MAHDGPRRPLTLLTFVILILLGQIFWQEHRLQEVKYEMGFQQRHFDEQVGRLTAERLRGRREDLIDTVHWLHRYYASNEGLRRPYGLWLPERQQLDAEAIGAWVFDVYLTARVNGATSEQARQSIIDAVRSSDEWRRAHAP